MSFAKEYILSIFTADSAEFKPCLRDIHALISPEQFPGYYPGLQAGLGPADHLQSYIPIVYKYMEAALNSAKLALIIKINLFRRGFYLFPGKPQYPVFLKLNRRAKIAYPYAMALKISQNLYPPAVFPVQEPDEAYLTGKFPRIA